MAEKDIIKGHAYFAAMARDSMSVSCIVRPTEDRKYYVMTPIDYADVQSSRDKGQDVCVIMKGEEGEISMARYLSVFEENKQLRVQTERLKDTLVQLNQEYARAVARPAEYILTNFSESPAHILLLKNKRLAALEAENRKLKDLLQYSYLTQLTFYII